MSGNLTITTAQNVRLQVATSSLMKCESVLVSTLLTDMSCSKDIVLERTCSVTKAKVVVGEKTIVQIQRIPDEPIIPHWRMYL